MTAASPNERKSQKTSRYDVEGRYKALLNAGEQLLCASYDQAQPKQVAELAGVSVGLFYKHFANKRELLTAVMIRRLGKLHQIIGTEIADQESPERSLQSIVEETLAYFLEYRGLLRLFFVEIGYGDVQSSRQLVDTRENYRHLLRAVLNRGIQEACFVSLTPTEVELTISSITGTINWRLYELLVVEAKEVDLIVLRDELVALFLRGLRRLQG